VARDADDAGFDSLWVMDHFFQIRGLGPAEDPMLEGWTALGFLAAHTRRASLGLMVGGIHYRLPGLWVKAATTLDVLSGGRAWLGIGAAWNQEESDALGFPMPPLATRFEMLEETLQIAHAMFAGERGTEGRHEGAHYTATRLLNAPQSLARPRVPIMIGGGGERKTLRLVAQYADATNVFGGGNIHPSQVIRGTARDRRDPIERSRPDREAREATRRAKLSSRSTGSASSTQAPQPYLRCAHVATRRDERWHGHLPAGEALGFVPLRGRRSRPGDRASPTPAQRDLHPRR
jgi:F420-dependent oxidoreductase-like protein